MAKIAYILLCHRNPEAIVQQAEQLTAAGAYLAIHFDARAASQDFRQIQTALASNPNVTFSAKRIKCGWGEWSLVQATLLTLKSALRAFPRATHFYMLSGDCMPIKTAEYAHHYLDTHDKDFIESFDFFESNWIKTGMKEDRLIYRHFVNERKHKALFYASYNLQKQMRLTRRIPEDLQVQIGSQWWCLRRRTIEEIMKFADQRRDVTRFFKTTWIPDETFFQTLVRHLVPAPEIESRTLTFLMFSDYGMPVTFYNDHYGLLLGQDFLFARKISPEAAELKLRLGELYAQTGTEFQISNEGQNLYRFLTKQGREGRRFGLRFWEVGSSLGQSRELMIITCKKWHVAKRLLEHVRTVTDIPCIDYLFDEEDAPLPDLGGIQTSLAKRTRHRRSLVRMLFDYFETDRMVVCMDPASLDLIQDFYDDRSSTRLLQIDCDFDETYLAGHARRVGLAGEHTSQDALDQLLPTLRNDMRFESARLNEAGFQRHFVLNEQASQGECAKTLQDFFRLHPDQAQSLAKTPGLFKD